MTSATLPGEAEQYRRVREALGITDVSATLMFLAEGEDTFFELDDLLAGNVANLRYGRVLHTFLADGDGQLLADVYVATNDEEIIVLCEPCVPDAQVVAAMEAAPSLQHVTDRFRLLSVDGPAAWAIPAQLLSRDTLGMPYLSVETHPLGDVDVRLIRAGKTGEFGYLAMVPREHLAAVQERFVEVAEEHGGGLCGPDVHHLLRLDGRFFDIRCEGRAVRDPLQLGLQWMIDFGKEQFSGREAILERRAAGVPRRTVGVQLAEGLRGAEPGATVTCDGEAAGEVITAGHSYTLDRELCLALLDAEVAYSGLALQVDGMDARSISMPPFLPRSLSVKLEEV